METGKCGIEGRKFYELVCSPKAGADKCKHTAACICLFVHDVPTARENPRLGLFRDVNVRETYGDNCIV